MISKAVATLLPLLFGTVRAQTEFLDLPELSWIQPFAALGPGNAVTASPDGAYVYATSEDGQLQVFEASLGDPLLDPPYSPPVNGGLSLGSTSGVAFGSDFLVYAVTDGVVGMDAVMCRVAALSFSGAELFVSEAMVGACSGDPIVSSDDAYIFINTNTGLEGTFNILSVAGDGSSFYRESPLTPLDVITNTTSRPFGPLGIYRSPTTGAYANGTGNTNDMLVWSNSLAPEETVVCCSATWAFQFPIDDATSPQVQLLLPNDGVAGAPGWLSNAAPVLYNSGLSVVLTVSRSDFRSWNGNGQARFFFDHRPTSRNSLSYEKGSVRAFGSTVSPGLSSDPVEPQIYGATAGNQLISMNFDLSPLWEFALSSPVSSVPKVTPDDSRVFFCEEAGFMYLLASDGTRNWQVPLGATSFSDIDLSADGSTLYYGNSNGDVVAWTVAGVPQTEVPSKSPTAPTEAPSVAPSVMGAPSAAPVIPTDPPTAPPITPPTEPPSPPTSGASYGVVTMSVVTIALCATMTAYFSV